MEKYSFAAKSIFLERKDSLDQVVYSLIRVKDLWLARELFIRINESETSINELAKQYSLGDEKNTCGIVGPVALTQSHELVSYKLRSAEIGKVIEPFNVDNWWIIVKLENKINASFDRKMEQNLSYDLFYEELNLIAKDYMEKLIK
mgnify:CR=1 FL=1